MSNAEEQQQEPSMEEILASIRRIISEDGEEGEEQSPAAEAAETADAAQEAPAAEPAADVLELTDEVGEDGEVVSPEESEVEAEAQVEDDGEDGLELTDEVTPEPVDEAPAAEAEAEAEAEESQPDGDEGDGLLSEDKADATADAFADLMGAMSVATPMGGEGRTLEDIVKALMRPLLKQWLNDNLPPLVDRIVREEIEKVVGRARDR